MNYYCSILLIFIFSIGVNCELEHLELMNVEGWRLEQQFKNNYSAMVKDLEPQGYFSRMFGRSKKAKPEPQVDLEELAQIYGTLNSADTAAIYFLNKECREGGLIEPKTDPTLCGKYPPHLIKQTLNRISTINSRIINSSGLLTCPKRWANHAVTVEGLLKDIDPKNLLEYRVNAAISKVISIDEPEVSENKKDPVTADVFDEKKGEPARTETSVVEPEKKEEKLERIVEPAAQITTQKEMESPPTAQKEVSQEPEKQSQVQTQQQSSSSTNSPAAAPIAQPQPCIQQSLPPCAQPCAQSIDQQQPQPQPQQPSVQLQSSLASLPSQQPQASTQSPGIVLPQQPARQIYPSEQILNGIVGQMNGTNGAFNLSIKI